MSTPAIQYSGPVISPEVPWETRRHLQLLYQKLGNHTQAFQHVASQIAGIKTGSSTTTIIEGGGGGGSTPPTPGRFIGQGFVNDQSGQTGYNTAASDNGILLILNNSSPVAVSLTTDAAPFYIIITNLGTGTVTLAPSTGTINGGASLSLSKNQTVYVACDSTNWHSTAIPVVPQNTPAVAHQWITSYSASTGVFGQSQPAYSDISGTPTLPANTAAVSHQWFSAYNSTTGLFTQSQPAFSDISGTATAGQIPALSSLSGQITTSQLPASGLSVTITTAKLTTGGTNGSMTFTSGILTAQTPAT